MNLEDDIDEEDVIYNVLNYCRAEKQAKKVLTELDDVYKRVADITGVSIATVRKIEIEAKQGGSIFSTPEKIRKVRVQKELDNIDLCAIRQEIEYICVVKDRVPTLRHLLHVVRNKFDYSGGCSDLLRTLMDLGFKRKKTGYRGKRALTEKKHIIIKHGIYLGKMIENRNLPPEIRKNVVYLGEVYIDSSYKLVNCWQATGRQNNISEGKRYVVMHAGGENGFISNASLIYDEDNKNEDYHSEMNVQNFTKWVKEKLIPNISQPSIIVMDTAPYHSVIVNKWPSRISRKQDVIQWLTQNKIAFDPDWPQPMLLHLIHKHKPKPIYEINQILEEHGHTVLRLPPYHSDLNPMEYIWRIARHNIASLNVGSTDIQQVAEQAFAAITVDDWKQACQHVEKLERQYDERDTILHDNDNYTKLTVIVEDDDSSCSDSDDFIPVQDDEEYSDA